jgi:hypothetical protein
MTTTVHSVPSRHLSSLGRLRRHCADPGKASRYQELLTDYGIEVAAFSELVEHPRLIYVEQPGCWYYPEDLLRARLLRALIDTDLFAPTSGVLTLSLDAFSDCGVKRWYNLFTLWGESSQVHLLGSAYRRRHRHLAYAALPIEGDARDRMSVLFTTAADMLEAARISPEVFASHLIERFQDGIESGLRPMLPPLTDRYGLMRWAKSLRAFRLDEALAQLAAPCCELRSGAALHWTDFGQEIGALGPLFNRFLLTVTDPARMARALRRDLRGLWGQDTDHDISVAALITDDSKYRMIFFDADTESFYFRDGDEQRIPITWDEVRRLAEACRTGGPCGVLSYLMLAASGIYMVSDDEDGTSPFESAARTIHQRRIGLCFPSLAPAPLAAQNRDGFLRAFSDDFDRCCEESLDRFLV